VHIGCTRDEQLRWLHEAWTAACEARDSGIPVEAVTVWALFGLMDWDSLITVRSSHYEPGAFDTRAGYARPTALSAAVRSLVDEGRITHPAVGRQGWWRRRSPASAAARPLLVAVSGRLPSSALRRTLLEVCRARNLEVRLVRMDDMPADAFGWLARTIESLNPWAIVDVSGYDDVDRAELEGDACWRLPLLLFSSALVFDGDAEVPYDESDQPRPLSVFGRSKAAAEAAVLTTCDSSLVVRTSMPFDPLDGALMLPLAIEGLRGRRDHRVAIDLVGSPTYRLDLVNHSLDLLIDDARGIWHVVNDGVSAEADLLRKMAERFGERPQTFQTCRLADLSLPAPRPSFSALTSRRGGLVRPLDEALDAGLERLARQRSEAVRAG
jgi:dTDP-4-dehydrorhamnose reductase